MDGRFKSSRGFTLIEMIVALTILSLVVLATVTALRTLATTQTTLNYRSEKASEMRAVTGFLRRSLKQSTSIPLAPLKSPGATYFFGDEKELRWAAPLSVSGGSGGLSALKLFINTDLQLVVLIEPYLERSEWEGITPLVLVGEVQALSFFYRLSVDDPWQAQWDPYLEKQSPSHVKVSIQAGDKYWPEVIVALVNGDGGGL